MKKIIIGIAILAVAILMVYFTKPEQTSKPTNSKPKGIQTTTEYIKPSTATPPIIQSTIEELKCDQKAILAEMDALKSHRDERIKALTQQGIEAKRLSDMVKTHIKDHALANQIADPTPQITEPKKSSAQLAIDELQQNKELIEDLMLAVWAGDSDEIVDRFIKGNIQPLDTNSALHKHYLLNMIAMSGNNQLPSAIKKLYGDKSRLTPDVAASIIHSVEDPKTLRELLSRVTDINAHASNSGTFYRNSKPSSLIQLAVRNNKLEATKVLLELGAKADSSDSRISLNYFLRSNPESGKVITTLLDRGFTPQNASSAKHLATSLQENYPDLAARVNTIEAQLNNAKAIEFANLPNEFKTIINAYEEQYEPLNKQYLACIAQENDAKPKIPEYQPIDKSKIEQTVDQLVEQKVDYQQIIATLAALNKESVEYGYTYLRTLRNQSSVTNQMDSMPAEVRTLIGYLRQEDWSGMVEFMKTADINPAWDITPGSMIAVMLEKKAPESAIAAMAKISNKNNTQLLGQALHNPELFDQVISYGFNLNATDQNNKNLLYYAVKTSSIEKIDLLIKHGVSFQPDPHGYDSLDMVLRQMGIDQSIYEKLNQVGFPINANHMDYSLYLKTYYPDRYKKIVEVMPSLQVNGSWEPKS